jgi:hypothetical protein
MIVLTKIAGHNPRGADSRLNRFVSLEGVGPRTPTVIVLAKTAKASGVDDEELFEAHKKSRIGQQCD